MSTPRKTFNNYNSPYEKPVQQQYPSQSADYISLDMGGLAQPKQTASNEDSPAGYMNTQYFQNSNSKNNRGSNSFNNTGNRHNNRPQQYMQQERYTPRKHNNNDYQQQQKQFTPRKNGYQQQERYTPRKNNNDSFQNRQQHNTNPAGSSSIADYCHPTMTEDPWLELLERVHAIERSKISISTPLTSNNSEDDGEDSLPCE